MNSPIPVFFVSSGMISLPIIRGSKSNLNIMPSLTRFWLINSCFRASASMYMLRILYILNFRPFCPMRSCLYKIGPGDFSLMIGPTITMAINAARLSTRPPMMSIARFTISCPGVAMFMLLVTTAMSAIFSTVCLPDPKVTICKWIVTPI